MNTSGSDPQIATAPTRLRGWKRRITAGAIAATLALLGGVSTSTVTAAPAQAAAQTSCMFFDPNGTPPNVTIGVGVGPVSVSTNSSAFAADYFCQSLDRSQGRIYSLGYNFGPHAKWQSTCGYWVDFDFWDRATGQRYYHNQGSIVPQCVHSNSGFRTGGMPVTLRPYTTACATMYRHNYGVGTEPFPTVVRTCANMN